MHDMVLRFKSKFKTTNQFSSWSAMEFAKVSFVMLPKYAWSIKKVFGPWNGRRSITGDMSKCVINRVPSHYCDTIMSTMVSRFTRLTVVYSIVYSDADQRKHQSSASLAFVWGIHRWPVTSPHKGPVTRKMFPFDDVIISISKSIQNSLLPRKYNKYIQYTTYQQFIFKAMGTGHLLVYVSHNYVHTTISFIKVEQRCSCADH